MASRISCPATPQIWWALPAEIFVLLGSCITRDSVNFPKDTAF